MSIVVFQAKNGSSLFNKMLEKTQLQSVAKIKQNITYQTGVADGGGDLTLTAAKVGDIIYDLDNDDWFICTVATTTVVQISP